MFWRKKACVDLQARQAINQLVEGLANMPSIPAENPGWFGMCWAYQVDLARLVKEHKRVVKELELLKEHLGVNIVDKPAKVVVEVKDGPERGEN